MIEKFTFYFRHSLNDLWVNRQRSFFALLCIAAGVAAIVSLQTLAVMIGDTLTGNLQETNRGDIKIELSQGLDGGDDEAILQKAVEDGMVEEIPMAGPFIPPGMNNYRIGLGGLDRLRKWLDANYPGQTEMTYRLETADMLGIFLGSGLGTSLTDESGDKLATSVTPILIEPGKYPFYSGITSLDGAPLADLIQSPTDLVIDEKIAKALDASVGDTVHINGATGEFTVRGIVPTEAEVTDPFTGFFAAQFGFYYLDTQAAPLFEGLVPRAQLVYLRLQDPSRAGEINSALVSEFPYLRTTTIDDLKEQNKQISDQINQLVTIMGLVSLLLGSIGIINTMQVIVRRRTVEVAVLKTIGLQADQVTLLFLVEAFLMGVAGSLLGIVLGWAATFVIKGVAENMVAQPIAFRIALSPALTGFVVGTLVSTIFGFLPTLAAGQVRPGVVLRPTDNFVPRAGRGRTLLALAVIILALSAVAYPILGSFSMALYVTVGAFFAAGFLLLLLSFLIWLIGRFFPSLGIVDLKISLRQMLAGRGRAAVTLLALVVGVFSLSLITLFADSINSIMRFALNEGIGGNILVTAASESALTSIEDTLNTLDGVNRYQETRMFSATLVGLEEPGGTLTVDQIKQRVNDNTEMERAFASANRRNRKVDFGEIYIRSFSSFDGLRMDQLPERTIVQGRQLTADDANRPVMVITDDTTRAAMGVDVGDRLIYRFGEGKDAPTVAYEVVGLTQMSLVSGIGGGQMYVPLASIPEGIQPSNIQIIVDITEDQIPELRRQIGATPGTFVLETSFFTQLISSLLGTFTAFPTMVAALGLIVGGVVIANSVALTTMERRREIAVMKAVGLQRERVLGMILLENGVLGLIGGLIGVGIGLLALILMLASTGGIGGEAIPFGTALLLMLLCIAVALIAAVTSAWGASGEKPLNVLRYE